MVGNQLGAAVLRWGLSTKINSLYAPKAYGYNHWSHFTDGLTEFRTGHRNMSNLPDSNRISDWTEVLTENFLCYIIRMP